MIQVGDIFTHRFSYTQEQVDLFAQVSGDTNPLHIDEEYAKSSMFGRRIMHGFLGGCVFTKIFGTLYFADGNVYLSQSMKFMKPMFTDQEYEAKLVVKEIFPEKNRVLLECNIYDVASGDLTTTGEALILNKK
ncbi:MAG: MaoC family dehydratase, partial [Bacteroidetes bacterium]|nr:MaoC family dehydratase [Bacteroidota bacterium]